MKLVMVLAATVIILYVLTISSMRKRIISEEGVKKLKKQIEAINEAQYTTSAF